MKTLLTEKSIRDIIARGEKSVCIDENTIVTPAAKDVIKYEGLEVVDHVAAPTPVATALTAAAPTLAAVPRAPVNAEPARVPADLPASSPA